MFQSTKHSLLGYEHVPSGDHNEDRSRRQSRNLLVGCVLACTIAGVIVGMAALFNSHDGKVSSATKASPAFLMSAPTTPTKAVPSSHLNGRAVSMVPPRPSLLRGAPRPAPEPLKAFLPRIMIEQLSRESGDRENGFASSFSFGPIEGRLEVTGGEGENFTPSSLPPEEIEKLGDQSRTLSRMVKIREATEKRIGRTITLAEWARSCGYRSLREFVSTQYEGRIAQSLVTGAYSDFIADTVSNQLSAMKSTDQLSQLFRGADEMEKALIDLLENYKAFEGKDFDQLAKEVIVRVISSSVASEEPKVETAPKPQEDQPAAPAPKQGKPVAPKFDTPMKEQVDSPQVREQKPVAPSVNAKSRPLSDLSIQEVGDVLDSLNLGMYRAFFEAAGVDGELLSHVQGEEDLNQLGVVGLHARKLHQRIVTFQKDGVMV